MYEAEATTTPIMATQLQMTGKKAAWVNADRGLRR